MKINPQSSIFKTLIVLFFVLQLNVVYAWQLQPDLIVVESALRNSLSVKDTIFEDETCFINEGCLSGIAGTGNRQLIKFTTQISNVGDADFYVGATPQDSTAGNDIWVYDSCHKHFHLDGYAEYVLLDEQDNVIPVGFKSGFCLADIQCDPGYTKKYTCLNQGISAHCTDIYSSGLACQWIDVTNVSEGVRKSQI